MSDQRWSNETHERVWLALRWHVQVLFGLRALDQHRNNRSQLGRPDEQNDIRPTSFVNVGPTKCQQNANVGPTNNCFVGSVYGNKLKISFYLLFIFHL